MISIPTPATDAINLADWLELQAFFAADGNASFSDLRRALATMGLGEDENDEILAGDAFSELSDRSLACGDCYPFVVDGSVLQTREDLESYWAYLFCLLLSYQGANRGEATNEPTRIFAEVAEIAARVYVSGKSLKFGFPRRVLPKNFEEAIQAVCKELGEGIGPKKRPDSQYAKDARLDIIAWRPFPDRRQGQMIMFGQCAAGGNWEEKLSDLQPRDFTDLYWSDPPAVTPLKGFFTPFRLPQDGWYTKAKYAGVLFDRCRIASFAHGHEPPPHLITWNEEVQDSIKGTKATKKVKAASRNRKLKNDHG